MGLTYICVYFTTGLRSVVLVKRPSRTKYKLRPPRRIKFFTQKIVSNPSKQLIPELRFSKLYHVFMAVFTWPRG